ncbi:hypothetical protein [cf. Phormidesmis sp. LEGE 11477]|uniref:hypothetical protein n=1 Tax=cf. Phormidesmis sp. LEGE 11477 TaxID=1828680 RepID=UPI001882DEB8|nr:hypothetical protein [cf. Phormidesmis sp. LEGE 11477]MBE9064087.1 hypothetical protein [cf. Phormidesmis sp. LEGE 11477]
MTFLNRPLKATLHNKTGRSFGPSVKKALLSLAVVGLSFSTIGVVPTSANPNNNRSARQLGSQVKDLAVLEDGVYLFGQSPQRDQIGSAYAIFSVANNQTIGAFYQPSSSFDCFYGQVHPDRMALNVVDSYEQSVHPYAIALTTDSSLTAGSGAPAYTLKDFHRIENVSTQDLDILAICEADFAQ